MLRELNEDDEGEGKVTRAPNCHRGRWHLTGGMTAGAARGVESEGGKEGVVGVDNEMDCTGNVRAGCRSLRLVLLWKSEILVDLRCLRWGSSLALCFLVFFDGRVPVNETRRISEIFFLLFTFTFVTHFGLDRWNTGSATSSPIIISNFSASSTAYEISITGQQQKNSIVSKL